MVYHLGGVSLHRPGSGNDKIIHPESPRFSKLIPKEALNIARHSPEDPLKIPGLRVEKNKKN
jgi:hypothetical protein